MRFPVHCFHPPRPRCRREVRPLSISTATRKPITPSGLLRPGCGRSGIAAAAASNTRPGERRATESCRRTTMATAKPTSPSGDRRAVCMPLLKVQRRAAVFQLGSGNRHSGSGGLRRRRQGGLRRLATVRRRLVYLPKLDRELDLHYFSVRRGFVRRYSGRRRL